MFLIDKPYVSNFLIETIKQNKFQLVATPEAKKLVVDKTLNWITEKKAIATIKNKPKTLIYSNSENAISWINSNLSFSKIPNTILFFKDKLKFRALIKDIYPDYFFKGVKLDALENLNTKQFKFPFIIKPSVGFFSMGVYIIENINDWKQACKQIKIEATTQQKLYPKEVHDTEKFIIEEYIEGEEYAIDAYFNENGEPIILSILHHIFSSGKDVSDRVYSTSKKIIMDNLVKVEAFLKIIGEKLDLTNFPIHMEIRINDYGNIIPIEINPMRSGGWCTTADLSWYAYGINSYTYFIKNLKPDWTKIFKNKSNEKYNIIVLNNNSGFQASEIDYFDYGKLLKDFKFPLVLRKVNFRDYPLFGFLFTKTNSYNNKELTTILNANLRKYIFLK